MSFVKACLITTLFCISLSASGIPIEDMTKEMLGIEYCGGFSGQTITKAKVPSRFQTHYFMLHYAPIQYLLISGGVGGSTFETDVFDSASFKGNAGLSLTGALEVFSPKLFNRAALTGGISVSLINSKKQNYDYVTMLFTPNIGILLYICNIFDFTFGAKGQILSGTMKNSKVNSSFSNNNYARGFLSATLHSLHGRSYATMTFDISPKSSTDWSFGPNEASVGLQVGYFFRLKSKNVCDTLPNINSIYFRDFDKMKQMQEKMADDMKECE